MASEEPVWFRCSSCLAEFCIGPTLSASLPVGGDGSNSGILARVVPEQRRAGTYRARPRRELSRGLGTQAGSDGGLDQQRRAVALEWTGLPQAPLDAQPQSLSP